MRTMHISIYCGIVIHGDDGDENDDDMNSLYLRYILSRHRNMNMYIAHIVVG
jgi:hypothetical protein